MVVMNVHINAKTVVRSVVKVSAIDVNMAGNGNLKLLDVNPYVEMD